MTSIIPIPTTRVSDLLTRNRLLSQIQLDQKDLFRLQTQLSTGRRIFLPSEDAPSALRAASLQNLLERKQQVQTNLTTNQSFLSASDAALGNVANLLADIRGSALSVAGTTSSSIERATVGEEIDRAVQQLVDVGNQRFRDRFLFAGTNTTQEPFSREGGYVRYNGDEGHLRSFSDIDVLFETNLSGQEIFGALSNPVRGTVDLDPVVTENTLLSDLRGGAGITRGSIEITDGTNSRVIDLSNANTVGDVAGMIEANPPAGRQVFATVTPGGLHIELDEAGGGLLSIKEVGAGTTASELGILNEQGTHSLRIEGENPDPKIRPTTRLDDLLGSKAMAILRSPNANNDIVIRATTAGEQYNDVTIQLVDDELLQAAPGLTAGNEIAEFDSSARAARAAIAFDGADNDLLLTAVAAGPALNNVSIRIDTQVGGAGLVNGAGASYDQNAQELVLTLDNTNNAINAADIAAAIDADGTFSASFDSSVDAGNDGSGSVDGALVTIGAAGNTGNSGGAAGTLYVNIAAGTTTAQQVVDAINGQLSEFSAEVDRSDATSPVLAGVDAVSVDATSTTFGGSGEPLDKDSGLQIVNGGETHHVNFATASTVEDLLNILNGGEASVLAQINAAGSGIDIRSRLSGPDFSIGENGGTTATQLGVRSLTLETPLTEFNHGIGVHSAEGTDFTVVRNDGVELDIDISGAVTVGDVIELINSHPLNVGAPATARLSSLGFNNDLLITAGQNGTALNDVNIQLVDDAALQAAPGLTAGNEVAEFDAVGRAATTALTFGGTDNDLILEAASAGIDFNNVTVAVTSTAAGAPTASYDPDNKVLTIDIEADGSTNANQIIAALGAVPEFTATLDTSDEGANSGLGVIGAFTDANFASTGNSGGEPGTLFINIEAGVSTAQQVADAINAEGTFAAANDHFDATSEALAGKGAVDATATAVTSGGSGIAGDNSPVQVVAQLAAQGNGIELVDDSPFGADSQGNPRSVKVLNHQSSQAAVDLGFVAKGETESSTTIPGVAAAGDADLTGENTDITFTARNAGTPLNGVQVEFVNNAAIGDQALVSYDAGTRTLTIDVEFGTTSANTVIDAVNGQAGGLFSAALSTAAGENTGQGTIDAADTGVVATLSGGTADVLTAADRNPLETEGVFNTLHRLQQALLENDTVAIERMLKSLDDDMLRLNFGRAEAGARQQSLATLQIRLENEEVELTSALSKEIDVDFTEAISNFTARQAALEASLRTAGSVLQLTLLNFI